MKPSEKVKAVGLNSLTEVAVDTDESIQNLINWSENYPRRFELILKGLAFEKLSANLEKAFKSITKGGE
jgi:hypothetical protein